MIYTSIDLNEKFKKFSRQWSPKIIARMNDVLFKLVKFQGEFIWHKHPDSDEAFLVMEGKMRIDFRDGHVDLKAGDMFVVEKELEHKPSSEKECKILLIESEGTSNTGDVDCDLTKKEDEWI